jgi:hypothetical protein
MTGREALVHEVKLDICIHTHQLSEVSGNSLEECQVHSIESWVCYELLLCQYVSLHTFLA